MKAAAYILLLCLAFMTFYIFKPYSYVDNATSLIICDKNGQSFESGWNFIYTFENKLDSFNDIKARKLCEYNLIKDYNNSLKTPSVINYRFEPKYIWQSSFADAIFMFAAVFLLGRILIESIFKKAKINWFLIIGGIFIALILFLGLAWKPSRIIFCKRQVARKVNNFKRVIFKYNIYEVPEEDRHISSVIKPLYEKCLKEKIF